MTREQIIQAADEAHARYPQYVGHWDGPEWFLVRFTRRVKTKMGIAFEAGDITLAKAPDYRDEYDSHPTAYSLRNTIDTSVPWKSFEVIKDAAATREP